MTKLTDRTVAALTCPPGRKDALFFDGALKGFGLRVTAAGTRTFLFQYRAATGIRRMPIGTFGAEVTTAQARARAEKLRGDVREGRDPVLERAEARLGAIEAEADAKRAASEAVFTLGRLVDDWDRKHLARMRPSYRRDAIGRLRLHLSALLNRPAGAIDRTEAVRELDRIATDAGETTARRVMGYARSAYTWARKRAMLNVNPFDGLPPIGREVQRDRVLTHAELGAIWTAAERLGPIHGGFARFLLLTLARREEVARMTWAEVSADLSTWTLPADRAKNGKAHVVHLAESARDILRALPRMSGTGLVFATAASKGLTTFSYIARMLSKHASAEGWRLHDFRRTGVTALAGMGFSPAVCDRLLNHVQGTIRGVAAIYQRHEFLKEREAALNAWAAHVLGCANGSVEAASNVVSLPRAG